MNANRCRTRTDSRGFTLVELLVVITIMGILVGLLVPAIMGAFRRANSAATSAEIVLLSNALAAFKDKYGDYPPSRIILREDGIYSTTATGLVTDLSRASGDGDLTVGDLNERSLRYLRKFWPRARFNTSGLAYDFNGDGDNNDVVLLDGAECLVFFLGGIRSSSGVGTIGFGKSPINPFVGDNPSPAAPSTGVAVPGSSNRETPYFEFKAERLVDVDGDGMYEYADTLAKAGSDARPYAYFSAYGANGYDPNDVNFAYDEYSGASIIRRSFRVSFTVSDGSGNTGKQVISASPNPYTSSIPDSGGTTPTTYQNGNTYQIISAGNDRYYGLGGQFDGSSTGNRLPYLATEQAKVGPAASATVVTIDPSMRQREADNLSNFSSGPME